MTAPVPAADTATAAAAGVGSAAALAASARLIQLAVRARLLRDTAKLWPLLDGKRLEETFPGWLAAMTLLIKDFHGQSSAAAAAFYRKARADVLRSPTPSSLIRLAPTPAQDWLARALGYAGPGMLSKDTARPGTALSTTLGTVSRIALDGGRTTIVQTVRDDPAAVGWFRVTDGRPCAFCALLASRGVVYKRDTVGFKSHNDCGCSGAPAFTRNQELPEISRTAADVYQSRGEGDPLVAFRKSWAEHLADTA